MLSKINQHKRDKLITFQEEGHIYTLYDLQLTHKLFLLSSLSLYNDITKIIYKLLIKLSKLNPVSVTTLIHSLFPEFNANLIIKRMMKSPNWPNSQYYGKTPEEIKEGWKLNGQREACKGTYMHADIERYLNKEEVHDENTVEFKQFKQFWFDFQEKYPQFKPYRMEWTVFDETFRKRSGICGSIDCILSDDDNNIIILDWKRSKEIKRSSSEKGYPPFNDMPNCNLSHYQLQLNIYRHILETKYDKNVIYMMLCIFHPNQKQYQCIPVDHINIMDVWDKL
jgi:ATP-dependent exoDNAse (exonuclease V) beta subunit